MPNPYQRRPRTHVPPLHQRGFSLLAVIIFAVACLGLASYFLIAKSVTVNNIGTADRGRAGMILSQGAAIQAGFNVLLSKGIAPDQIRLDATVGVGIYNDDAGGTVPQVVDPSDIRGNINANGIWLYRGAGLQNPGVGSGGSSYAVMISGLTNGTCIAINSVLHNYKAMPVISDTAVNSFRSRFATAANPNDFSSGASLSANATVKGWDKGCVLSSDNSAIYFQVLLPQ